MQANKEIRLSIAGRGLKHWQVAEALNLSESVLSRLLRKELPTEEKEKILSVINELAKEN